MKPEARSPKSGPARPPVETVYPLLRRGDAITPFPTRYWLHDPAACRRMGELERGGAVGRLEARIAADVRLRHAFAKDHAAYRDQRWDALTPADRAWVRARPEIRRTFAGGIGGTADFTRIKCLHLHWAHHLAVGGTTAGRLIAAMCRVTEWPSGRVAEWPSGPVAE